MSDDGLDDRLEMLLVARWLDEGAPDDGSVTVPVAAAARELGMDDDRVAMLAVMAALGDLEDRRLVTVSWPLGTAGGEALVRLGDELRADAGRLFGRG